MDAGQHAVLLVACCLMAAAVWPFRRSYPALAAYWIAAAPYSLLWQSAPTWAPSLVAAWCVLCAAESTWRLFSHSPNRWMAALACCLLAVAIICPLMELEPASAAEYRLVALAAAFGGTLAAVLVDWLSPIRAPQWRFAISRMVTAWLGLRLLTHITRPLYSTTTTWTAFSWIHIVGLLVLALVLLCPRLNRRGESFQAGPLTA